MTRPNEAGLRRSLRRGAILALPPLLCGCGGPPAIDVVGSFFPAWMLCSLAGIAIAVGVRRLLILVALEGRLLLAPVTHAAIALAATLAVWLVWFGH